MKLNVTELSDAFAAEGISSAIETIAPLGEFLRVSAEDAKKAVRIAKTQGGYDYYIDVFGIDISAEELNKPKKEDDVKHDPANDGVDVTVHLRNFAPLTDLYIKVRLPYGGTWNSIWEDFPAAAMPERELCEMFGLKLAGHPNPKRLLTTDGLEPPLLKSTKLRSAEEVRD